MRRLCSILALGLLTGCAAHRVTAPMISTSWTTVQAIAPGTEVGVLVGEGVRYGRIRDVTDQSVTLWERKGLDTLPRDRIERVTLRRSAGPSRLPRTIKTGLASAVVAGLLGMLIAASGENHGAVGDGWGVFVIGSMVGTMVGAARAPQERFDEQLVYIRP